MNKSLLFITHHQLDQNNGGANASKGFLRCFASLFDRCAVICHAMAQPQAYIPEGVAYYPMQDRRSKPRKLVDMYRGAISGHYYFVREHLRQHHYDVVVIDHTFTGAGLSWYIKQTGARLITIHHNVERDYLRDNSKEKPLLYRYPFLYYCRKSERDCLRNSDLNLTVTERDATVFRSWFPDSQVFSWGIFDYRSITPKQFSAKGSVDTFAITGSLCFEQSLRPIMVFIDRYWPVVVRRYPDARLLVAGRRPAETLKRLCDSTGGVTLIPDPDDIAAVVRQADCYICPISAGSGLKLRVWDGLKEGLPVLCHEVSAAGYEHLADNGCLFPYHDEQSFAEALDSMARADIAPRKVYQTFQDTFSLQAGREKLESILRSERIL